MARYITIATAVALCVVSVASNPDAPLYPNTVFFASGPLLRQPVQAAPQFVTRPATNGAYTIQNPTFFVAAQPNQNSAVPQQQRVVTSPAGAAPQGTIFRIVSEEAPSVQSVPQNFVTFTRTPNQQVVQLPAEQVQSVPRNFVTFTRTPTQQFAQTPAEQVQSVPRNFVTFTRTPQQIVQPAQQQDFGSRTVLVAAPAQANEQPFQFAVRAPVQQQFGQRNVLVPAASNGEAGSSNALPLQRTGVRTVFLSPAQQASPQTNSQANQKANAVISPRHRTALVDQPAQAAGQAAAAQPQQAAAAAAGNIQNQPSSSQFFTRNFGGSGAVTYFIHPLSAPAGQAGATFNQPAPDTET